MIDKIIIKFSNNDLTLEPNTKVKVSTLPRSPMEIGKGLPEPLLCYNTQGKPVYGAKGYFSDELLTFNLYPKSGTIRFNFPKISQFGVNLHPIDRDEAENIINLVDDRLLSSGVRIDLKSCKIKYIEVYKNLKLTRQYHEYIIVLSLLQIKRGFEKGFETSYYLGNDSRKLFIYDKTRQLIDKQFIKPETRSITGSLMRVEYRLEKDDVVNRELKFSTLADLLDDWDNLNDLYKESVEGFLQPYEKKIPNKIESFESESDVMEYFFDTYGTSGWNNYRKYHGSRAILEKWNPITDLTKSLISHKHSAAISRHIKELRLDAMEIPISAEISPVGLLQEFKSMLLS